MTSRRSAAVGTGLITATAGTIGGRKLRAFYRDLHFETAEDEHLVARTDDEPRSGWGWR